jgi:hypothetical protein
VNTQKYIVAEDVNLGPDLYVATISVSPKLLTARGTTLFYLLWLMKSSDNMQPLGAM